MAAADYSVFRPQHVDAIQFGDTAWSSSDFTATDTALDTSFASNNGTILLDLVGAVDSNSPVKSAAFAKDITYSGNERSTNSEPLLGADTNGTQNQESSASSASLQVVEFTLVYRNNVPFSIFNDTTKACLMTLDNSESSSTGVANFAFNNITMLHVGSIAINPDGLAEQKMKFSHKGGTTGSEISVTQAAPAETWSRIVGGDYAEEVRLT